MRSPPPPPLSRGINLAGADTSPDVTPRGSMLVSSRTGGARDVIARPRNRVSDTADRPARTENPRVIIDRVTCMAGEVSTDVSDGRLGAPSPWRRARDRAAWIARARYLVGHIGRHGDASPRRSRGRRSRRSRVCRSIGAPFLRAFPARHVTRWQARAFLPRTPARPRSRRSAPRPVSWRFDSVFIHVDESRRAFAQTSSGSSPSSASSSSTRGLAALFCLKNTSAHPLPRPFCAASASSAA